jgi:hypothetical protein
LACITDPPPCLSLLLSLPQPFIPERVESMAVFKHFVSTAQREFVAGERAKNPAAVEFGVRWWCCLSGDAV